jgi:hypothetical protein
VPSLAARPPVAPCERAGTAGSACRSLHLVEIGLVQDRVAQDPDRGDDVDHDAVDIDRTQALNFGLGIGLLQLAGVGDILGLGRVDLERSPTVKSSK